MPEDSRSSSEATLEQEGAPNGGKQHDDSAGGAEKGERGDERQASIGFWDKDLSSVRMEVFKKSGLTSRSLAGEASAVNVQTWLIILPALMLSTFILAILSLYWGVLFRVEQNMSALVVWVVDFDGQVAPYTDTTPLVGPAVVQVAESSISPSGSIGWGSLPASGFNNDPMEVRQAIYDEKAWAAIIINANSTTLLQDAVNTGNSSYDPMGAAQLIYVQARDETTLEATFFRRYRSFKPWSQPPSARCGQAKFSKEPPAHLPSSQISKPHHKQLVQPLDSRHSIYVLSSLQPLRQQSPSVLFT